MTKGTKLGKLYIVTKKATKSVKNSKVTKMPAKKSKLYETYEKGYYVLQDGKVWRQIVDGKDNVKGGKDTP